MRVEAMRWLSSMPFTATSSVTNAIAARAAIATTATATAATAATTVAATIAIPSASAAAISATPTFLYGHAWPFSVCWLQHNEPVCVGGQHVP